MRAWGTGLLISGLCAAFLGSGTASAVAGADEVPDGGLPFVAKITFGDQRSCTGALVTTQWIVTAKSCFTDGTDQVAAGPPAKPTEVVLARADLTKVTGHRLAVTSIVPQPDRNVVLAQLSAPVKDITPVSLDGDAPQPGETLRIAGYGRTGTEWVPDRMHAGSFTVGAVETGSFAVTGVSSSATLCKGDAGGPALREVSGVPQLVGISDVSWQKGCRGEPTSQGTDGAFEARTDDLADWIRSTTAVQPSALREPVAGEFNRDGKPDLIAADAAGVLWLYPGTATRNQWGTRLRVGSNFAGYREMVVGRINRDDYDDLVTIETATGKLWMYPGTAAGGAFGVRVQIGSGWTDFRDLAIGKVNRDQYDDLLTVKDSTQQLFLYAGNATGPNFNAGVQYGTSWGCCTKLTLGRFNDDDYTDLLTTDTTGKLRIYAGNAAGANFNAGVDTGAGAAWNASSYLVRGQFDGTGLDGLLEVDATTGLTWLHPRTATGGWDTRIAPVGKLYAPQPYELTKLATGEFTRDGYTDVIGVDAAGALWLHPGTAAKTFGSRVQIGSGWTGYRDLVVGRINRDDYDDLVTIETATGKLWMYPGTAAGGAFGVRVQIGSGWTDFRDLAIGKVNRDQYDDLLTVKDSTQQLFLYAGNATGPNFNAGVQYGTSWGCCTQLTVGRFNDDDYADLLTADTTGNLRIYAGNAGGANFDPSADSGAGADWLGRSELTPIGFGSETRSSLLAKDSSGALIRYPAQTGTGLEWSDPVPFGPRD